MTNEQSDIAYIVLQKILEWKLFPKKHYENNRLTFIPLRMTVIGKAGTGKSFLIQSLITAVRQFTNINDSVIVTAQTGKS